MPKVQKVVTWCSVDGVHVQGNDTVSLVHEGLRFGSSFQIKIVGFYGLFEGAQTLISGPGGVLQCRGEKDLNYEGALGFWVNRH